ncbi:Ureidoglycolate lyase [Candidatus Entotheonellaceae bacterium PAL068K]
MKIVHIKAEPLTSEAYEPFGQVIGLDDVQLHLRQDEQFRMTIIHAKNSGYRISHLNHHLNSTQALIPLEGKAYIIVVAPPEITFEKAADLKKVKAFLSDGSVGVNIGLHTWHQALLPIGPEIKMVNMQGVNSGKDTYVCDFEDAFDMVIEVRL